MKNFVKRGPGYAAGICPVETLPADIAEKMIEKLLLDGVPVVFGLDEAMKDGELVSRLPDGRELRIERRATRDEFLTASDARNEYERNLLEQMRPKFYYALQAFRATEPEGRVQ